MKAHQDKTEYLIDTFQPKDAEGVADLFRSVYGEGYPIKTVYQPEELIAAFEKRENIPIVARTSAGRIVAYEALYRSSPNPDLYEAGQGLVDAGYRGGGINRRINEYLFSVLLPSLDTEGVFGEAVCNHIYMQKGWGRFETIETALEVDLMPAEAYEAEASSAGRVAALLSFRLSRTRRHQVFLPVSYRSQLEWIYSSLTGGQDFQTGGNKTPSNPSRIELQLFDFAKVARITIWEAGPDLERVLSRQEETLKNGGFKVFQIWLDLSWPFVDKVVETVRGQGYFFGGLLPRWFGSDGLLLQKVMPRPNWEGIHLYSDRAKKILDFAHQDWRATAPGEEG